MSISLALTALMMGLAGGPHCLAMCGVACVGLGWAQGAQSGSAWWLFQIGRLLGYALLGAAVAATMQSLNWLSSHSAALRPWWTLLHVAALALGMYLLLCARQPVWLDRGARGLWQWLRPRTARRGGAALVGLLWALLPCGLLYSALLVAALAGGVWAGAGTMALFALGSALWLWGGRWLWLRLSGGMAVGAGTARGQWGVRVAGAALSCNALWILLNGTAVGRGVLAWCLG